MPIRTLRALLSLLALIATFAATATPPALAQMQPGPGNSWLTIASRTKPGDAIALAQQYADRFPSTVVFQGSNGFFAVTLGWTDTAGGKTVLADLISRGEIPADSYFTGGARFVRAIWSATGAHSYDVSRLYAATRLGRAARSAEPRPRNVPDEPPPARAVPMPPTPAEVANLENPVDGFLSLREGPGTGFREVLRMRAGTGLTVTGQKGGWFEVEASNGARGWVFGKYVALGRSPREKPVAQQDVPVIGPETKAEAPLAKETKEAAVVEPKAEPKAEAVAPAVREQPAAGQKAAVAGTQRRVALVIGNSRYEHTAELTNPKNDAAAMDAKLRELGFEVVSALDGSKTQMEGAVRDFVKALPGADVALFFYAGHAMQVNGRNFLIPVDAKLEDSTALDFETIDLQVVLDFMNETQRIAIAFVDACRDNPLSRRFARKSRSGAVGNGLAAPATEGGEMLIGFATAPGKVALDGDGANSPFTTALLRHIGTAGVDVEVMLKAVKRDVYEMTASEQEPWHNSALRTEFYFNPAN